MDQLEALASGEKILSKASAGNYRLRLIPRRYSTHVNHCHEGRMEEKTARFTLLIDADQKRAFEQLCEAKEVTASHMVRVLISQYLQDHGTASGAFEADATE